LYLIILTIFHNILETKHNDFSFILFLYFIINHNTF
jgi:hypothetical protein